MSEHTWFHENLTGYLAEGLTGEERERFQRHLRECRECAQALEEWRGFESSLAGLFTAARPRPGLEGRMIAGLRTAPLQKRVRRIKLLRWIGSAAAVVFLGLLGLGMHHFAETGEVPLFGGVVGGRFLDDEARMAARVKRERGRDAGSDSSVFAELPSQHFYRNQSKVPHEITGDNFEGKRNANGAAVLDDSLSQLRRELDADDKGKELKELLDLPANPDPALGKLAGDGAEKKSHVIGDMLGMPISPPAKEEPARQPAPGQPAEMPPTDTTSRDGVLKGGGAGGFGGGFRATGPGGAGPANGSMNAPYSGAAGVVPTAPAASTYAPPTAPPPPVAGPAAAGQPGLPGLVNQQGQQHYYYLSPSASESSSKKTEGGRPADSYFHDLKILDAAPDDNKTGKFKLDVKNGDVGAVAQNEEKKTGAKKPADPKGGGEQTKPGADQAKGDQAKGEQPKSAEPPKATRKIIRTGEVEFEIEAFDSAVAEINRLISGIPGAFIATVNSEKLPNGKVKGSVVVRVPPDNLDKFLLDVRKDLGKTGELKSQRIGSQDITKQFYDLESRLRAARTMEERLLDIIKKGKGEIKELLAAEKELGVWRTKIEEMEGEIRYYNNQVGLSTLTITLYEKEIRAAAALVVTERVTMQIDVDDVEKAYQSALAAVSEAKGRVIKADRKEHAAGQWVASLEFEVAPAVAPKVREKLKLLGVVSQYDAQQQQIAEGGTAGLSEIKSRQHDVHFSVALRNLANIKPQETYVYDIIVADVPAEYKKLQDAAREAKAQVRVANLDEQDKVKISGQLHFDVAATSRETFDKLVADLGDIIVKTTTRAAPGESATDRKVGYQIRLHNLADTKPRVTYHLDLATQDVPADYYKLQDTVAASKGRILALSLNEQDKANTRAQLDFDVPADNREAIDKLVASLGEITSKSTQRASPNENATERRVGFRLTFQNIANVRPRETYHLQIATQDVPADYYKLQDTVAASKGRILALGINEQDKANTRAQLDFDVPAEKKEAIDKLVASFGEITTKSTQRLTPNELATERRIGYRLVFANINSIPPRESYTLQEVTQDVPASYRKLQDAVANAKGYVRSGQLNEPDKTNVSAIFNFDVPADKREAIDKVLEEVGDVYSRTTERIPPEQVGSDRKVGYRLTLRSVAAMPPRESIQLDILVNEVDETVERFKNLAREKGATIQKAPVDHEANGRVLAFLEFDVPLAAKDELVRKMRNAGKVRVDKSSPNPQVPETKLATAHFRVFVANYGPIVPTDEGLWPRIRTGLTYSFTFLSMSLMFIVIGLSVVLPWALVIWVVVKIVRRMRSKPQPGGAVTG